MRTRSAQHLRAALPQLREIDFRFLVESAYRPGHGGQSRAISHHDNLNSAVMGQAVRRGGKGSGVRTTPKENMAMKISCDVRCKKSAFAVEFKIAGQAVMQAVMQDMLLASSSQSWQSIMPAISPDWASISITIDAANPVCNSVAAETATTISTSSDLIQVRMTQY
jgi:hypothetical protein